MKKLTIKKGDYPLEFITYLVDFTAKYIKDNLDYERLSDIDLKLGINSAKFIIRAADTLRFSFNSNSYIIDIDKTEWLDNLNLSTIISRITYGSREVKGYPLIDDVFDTVNHRIDDIYEHWMNGDRI